MGGVISAQAEQLQSRSPESAEQYTITEHAPDSVFRILGIDVRNQFLTGISRKLGFSLIYDIGHTGKAICYISNSQQIEFYESSIGYGYKVSTISDDSKKECATLNSSQTFVNGIGLALGLGKDKVTEILGKKRNQIDDALVYEFWVQEKEEHPESDSIWADITTTIYLQFNEGYVGSYSVSATKTY